VVGAAVVGTTVVVAAVVGAAVAGAALVSGGAVASDPESPFDASLLQPATAAASSDPASMNLPMERLVPCTIDHRTPAPPQ
jgi:hypothetical protein